MSNLINDKDRLNLGYTILINKKFNENGYHCGRRKCKGEHCQRCSFCMTEYKWTDTRHFFDAKLIDMCQKCWWKTNREKEREVPG